MTREKFYKAVQEQSLENIPIDLSTEICIVRNTYGLTRVEEKYRVYYVDNESVPQTIAEYNNEEEALDCLLAELRKLKN